MSEDKKTRWSSKRKLDVVMRLLAGESLENVSREIGVEAYRIAEWRDRAQECHGSQSEDAVSVTSG